MCDKHNKQCRIPGPRGPRGPQGATGPAGENLEFLTTEQRISCNVPQTILKPIPDVPEADIVIDTPGAGRFIRVQSITDPILYGDCRGDYAIDFQSQRSASNQVAAGDSTNIFSGINNLIDDTTTISSIIGGLNNAVIVKYVSDLTYTTQYATIVSGYNNSLIGCSGCTIVNGSDNTISLSTYSTIENGDDNTIGNTAGVEFITFSDHVSIENGTNNFISGQVSYATIDNGNNNRIINDVGFALYKPIYCNILNGLNNRMTSSDQSIIDNGSNNIIVGCENSNISNGINNIITSNSQSNILNGNTNNISSGPSFLSINNAIDNGSNNTIFNSYGSHINNGTSNFIFGVSGSHISNGISNNILSGSDFSLINNGSSNRITDDSNYSIINNGISNGISLSDQSSINNGIGNIIAVGSMSDIINGSANNIINSQNSTTNNGISNLIENSIQSTCINGSTGHIVGINSTILNGVGINIFSNDTVAYGKYNNPGQVSIPGITGATGAIGLNGERIFMIGNGIDNLNRHNLFSINNAGLVITQGAFASSTNADYGEYFESDDGNIIPIGTSVVILPNRKIRKAVNEEIPYGVISKNPGFLANSQDEIWHGKYLRNEFGDIIYETVAYNEEVNVTETTGTTGHVYVDDIKDGIPIIRKRPEYLISTKIKMKTISVYDENDQLLGTQETPLKEIVTKYKQVPKISPEYDPTQVYIPRSQRKEWHVVGLLGVVPILNNENVDPKWIILSGASLPNLPNSTYYFIK